MKVTSQNTSTIKISNKNKSRQYYQFRLIVVVTLFSKQDEITEL